MMRGFRARRWPALGAFALLLACTAARPASAEDGSTAWLRYAPLSSPQKYGQLPSRIVVLCSDPIDSRAAQELQSGLGSMLGRRFTIEHASFAPTGPAITLSSCPHPTDPATQEAYQVSSTAGSVRIEAQSPQAELYAVFHLLEEVAATKPLPANDRQAPAAPIRWVDEWDNPDGTIERGYAGPSLFFSEGHIRQDLGRAEAYARLLASIGINGCNINNVNADLQTLTTEHLQEFARVATVFRKWGVRLALSIDLSSPQTVGGLKTFDPVDPEVVRWWQSKADEIYRIIPDFAGFTVKADSEGRAGPSQYHRTPAEAANVLARALHPHGGIVMYRGFVYNHHLDWNDKKADRARAGYDNFRQLDGKFEPNVIIQVKHGPIDFQVREPVSPLFAALQHTPQAIEVQTSQEYTGQQRHMVFLLPMWKQALDTDLRAGNRATPVKQIVEGVSFHQPTGGFVSVVNVGMDPNWLHHPMALANLYGYGRMAWNPDTPASDILDSWTRMTFGNNPKVVEVIDRLQMSSWQTYESYTGPFGIGTLTDIINVHFGPGVGSAENNGWGQWFRADHEGVGMDRTVATGTGYIGQYPLELARVYESLATCPEDLLLFMQHVAYTHRMRSGKTLIQAFYDRHNQGAAEAAQYPREWQTLHGLIDEERYQAVLHLLEYQAGHAEVWREAVNTWFERMSGIADASPHAHPLRLEAEAMQSVGYRTVDATPAETVSGGKAVQCAQAPCSLSAKLEMRAGIYRVAVQYFDLHPGVSHFELLLNGKTFAHFSAADTLPPAVADSHLDGHTSTRFVSEPLQLHSGDTLMLRAVPDQGEPAPVDYLELIP